MNNEETITNGFLIIPNNISFDDRLNSNDKIIYSYIYALSKKYGYCFATNSHIANKFSLARRTVQRTIEKLNNYKYIKSDGNNKRKIYVLNNNDTSSDKICHTNYSKKGTPTDKNCHTPYDKNDIPCDKNCHTRYDKNVTHNNINYNNNYKNNFNNKTHPYTNFTQRDYSNWTTEDWNKLYFNYYQSE